jgi:hypothetical protein
VIETARGDLEGLGGGSRTRRTPFHTSASRPSERRPILAPIKSRSTAMSCETLMTDDFGSPASFTEADVARSAGKLEVRRERGDDDGLDTTSVESILLQHNRGTPAPRRGTASRREVHLVPAPTHYATQDSSLRPSARRRGAGKPSRQGRKWLACSQEVQSSGH